MERLLWSDPRGATSVERLSWSDPRGATAVERRRASYHLTPASSPHSRLLRQSALSAEDGKVKLKEKERKERKEKKRRERGVTKGKRTICVNLNSLYVCTVVRGVCALRGRVAAS